MLVKMNKSKITFGRIQMSIKKTEVANEYENKVNTDTKEPTSGKRIIVRNFLQNLF